MKSRIYPKTFANIDELIEEITKTWDEIDNDYLNKLIDNHSRKVLDIYESEGKFI